MVPRRLLTLAALLFVTTSPAAVESDGLTAPRAVSIETEDGGTIVGNIYGTGSRAVVLVHGGQYRKESWDPQARSLVQAGLTVLAIDLRGFGNSTGPGQTDPITAPLHFDVLAAVRYLHASGARSVSVVGASMGGWAAADAVAFSKPGEILRLVLLGAAAGNQPSEKVTGPKLLIVSRGDRDEDGLRLPGIEQSFAKMPNPKRLLIVNGTAHAQAMFSSSIRKQVTREMIQFLASP